ncbi:hypothetical protein [Flavobacterium filum]|uniref:hypothetical protein n=1 Tax=Flavobacterium filum TaxID=370974 RepID=UPI0023F2B291|nr:hypothetical protein [Flavobacterium filum]
MNKITAIKDAKWYVEIRGKQADVMFWEAKSNMELGFYNNGLMQIDSGSAEHASKSWLDFADANGITNFEYVK